MLDLRAYERVTPKETTEGSPRRAMLSDYYVIERMNRNADTIRFLYSTSGSLEGQCTTHPEQSKWAEIQGDRQRRAFTLAVNLWNLAEGRTTRVINRLVYVGAFERTDLEWLETQIDRPTRSVTWIILFPNSNRCSRARGVTRVGRGQWVDVTLNQPQVLQDGELVYWRIGGQGDESPALDTQYGIEWHWASQR